MFQIGAWDFAGGMVVHESAGFSAFGALKLLGPRDHGKTPDGKSRDAPEKHSMQMILGGTAILWFGWFGFNGGSALAIGGLATIAFVNTQLAPASAMMMWIFLDWVWDGRPTLNGACAGVVAGLVVITPCAGFVQPSMAILAGIFGTCLSFFMTNYINNYTDMDDSCDTFGVHGCAGFLGTIFVGSIADPPECGDAKTAPEWCANPGTVTRSWTQTKIQAICAVTSATYSAVATYIILGIIFKTCYPLLTTHAQQKTTQDILAHGECAYVIGENVESSDAGDASEGQDEEWEDETDESDDDQTSVKRRKGAAVTHKETLGLGLFPSS